MPQDPNWYAAPAADAPPPPTPMDALDAPPEYAGFGVRVAARIADIVAVGIFGVIAGFAGGVLVAVLAAGGVMSAGWAHRLQETSLGTFAFGLLSSLVYHTISEGMGGASAGKLALGLRVLGEDLRPAGVGQALVRNLAYYIDGFFFGLVAYSAMGKSRWQQRLGDQWGHTVVVRAASLPPSRRGGIGLGLALGIVGHVVVGMASVVVRAL